MWCFHSKGMTNMSRNAIALKPSTTRQPIQILRSLLPARDARKSTDADRIGNGVRGVRDLILRLLQEVEILEHDQLFAEMASPPRPERLEIEGGIKLDDVVRQFEANLIRQALFITGGNQARAARLLGIKPNTLNYKIKSYQR